MYFWWALLSRYASTSCCGTLYGVATCSAVFTNTTKSRSSQGLSFGRLQAEMPWSSFRIAFNISSCAVNCTADSLSNFVKLEETMCLLWTGTCLAYNLKWRCIAMPFSRHQMDMNAPFLWWLSMPQIWPSEPTFDNPYQSANLVWQAMALLIIMARMSTKQHALQNLKFEFQEACTAEPCCSCYSWTRFANPDWKIAEIPGIVLLTMLW